jgi:hypothetical protein
MAHGVTNILDSVRVDTLDCRRLSKLKVRANLSTKGIPEGVYAPSVITITDGLSLLSVLRNPDGLYIPLAIKKTDGKQ